MIFVFCYAKRLGERFILFVSLPLYLWHQWIQGLCLRLLYRYQKQCLGQYVLPKITKGHLIWDRILFQVLKGYHI